MKCKDCYARNGESVCLIGIKARMLTCGHYGCNLQQRTVERRMGISKPMTNADRIRAMSDDELAKYFSELSCHKQADREICLAHNRNCEWCWLDFLKGKEADNG